MKVSLFQVPVISNAVGGILVGLVTAYAGGVRKASSPNFVLHYYFRNIIFIIIQRFHEANYKNALN